MRIGKQSYKFDNVYIKESATVTGPKEALGPLRDYFDYSFEHLHMNEKSWEKAELALLEKSIDLVMKKSNLNDEDIDLVISGDLINQSATTNYTMRNYSIPLIGIYGACSNAILGLLLASIIIDGKNANNILAGTSSHYGNSERQFRNPTEYGGPKPDSQTSTVSGAAMALVSNTGDIRITGGTLGMVIDVGASNPFDMGGAMAPACSKTLKCYFDDFNKKPSDFDLILTGDLSSIGKPILRELMREYKYDIDDNHNDAGLMIYNFDDETVFAGGSGCACIGLVSMGYIIDRMRKQKLKKVLLCGTGALLNPLIISQNETIPCICHIVALEVVE